MIGPEFRAMVLAAGLGTRLRPLTETTPKALMPVVGKPMIHYALDWLYAGGIREAAINTHHLGSMIEQALGDGSRRGLLITWSREEVLLGTGGGVAKMARLLPPGRLVLINCDTLIDADLHAVIASHERSGAQATLVTVTGQEPGAYTPVWVDSGGQVIGFGDHPRPGLDLQAVTYSGVAVLEPQVLSFLRPDRFSSLVAAALIPAIKTGLIVNSFHHPGYWKGLDSRDKIREAEADLAAGRFRPQI